MICPFRLFDLQTQYFLATLAGDLELPSAIEMREDTLREEERQRSQGKAKRHFHKLGSDQWDYIKFLEKMVGVEGVPKSVEVLYENVMDIRKLDLMNFKAYSVKERKDGMYYLKL